jgi:hypothetical protein
MLPFTSIAAANPLTHPQRVAGASHLCTSESSPLSHLPRCMQAWFGGKDDSGGTMAVIAAAPPGCWVTQWEVGSTWSDVNSLQAVLNDGTTLPILDTQRSATLGGVETVRRVEGVGGGFTEVHGRCGLFNEQLRHSFVSWSSCQSVIQIAFLPDSFVRLSAN